MTEKLIRRATKFLNRLRTTPSLSGGDFWLLDPAVLGFGCGIREPTRASASHEDWVLNVYVDRKKARAALSHPVPRRLRIPRLDIEIETNVVATGTLLTQAGNSVYGSDDISRVDGLAGKIGCLVKSTADPQGLFLLSNAHVLAYSGNASPKQGDPILQPPASSGGTASTNAIATLSRWTPFDPGHDYPNVADAAIGRVLSNANISPAIRGVGLPAGINNTLQCGLPIKISRNGVIQNGIIQSIDASFEWPYEMPNNSLQTFGFRGQVACTCYSEPGDSGSIVLDAQNRVVGIHLAGSENVSIFTPIRNVLTLLDLNLVTTVAPVGSAEQQQLADEVLPLGYKPPINDYYSAVDALARTIWGEARGEGDIGMTAVSAVVANRARMQRSNWGQTVEEVCNKPRQFSCWNSDDPNYPKLVAVGSQDNIFAVCLGIARQTLTGEITDPTHGATSYCNLAAGTPAWAANVSPTITIGHHTFYKI